MFNILKYPICAIKGHNVNPNESLVKDYMLDERNWLCKCHRCGIYVMFDGAMSGLSITMFEREAKQTAADFIKQFSEARDIKMQMK